MLYAFSVRGKMLFFFFFLYPKDYDKAEIIASGILSQIKTADVNQFGVLLSDALLDSGIRVTPVKIKKVFRPRVLKSSIINKL